MGQLRAVLWDMDGTLVDSEKLWTIALEELMIRLGAPLTDAIRVALIGSNMRRSSLLLLGHAEIEPTDVAIADMELWLNERMAEFFRADLPWRPGARAALRSVRESGVRTALVTSTERVLTEVALDTIGREFFDVTVCGDEVGGQNKPLPRPYLLAAELLGVDPANCVAVEDSVAGVTSAQTAGCTVLVVPAEAPVPPGERLILRESLVGVDAELLAGLLVPRIG
ncbi:MAG TPA: HAD family phosphatase [Pseudonocardiaceae bacterium]|jgi:HAD superfamily hydrolase (TIGR01509 family)|nr:HAD family phosphatase [Pseudonocardiaceae bacterium]